MNWLEEVRSLWEAYIAKTEQLERDKKPGAGIFGLTPGPKDDPCHGRFGEEAEALLGRMAAAEPDPEEIREVLAYIYRAPTEHREPLTAFWMLQAVHGFTAPLAEKLRPEDARALREGYERLYRRQDRFQPQKKALAALKKAEKQ